VSFAHSHSQGFMIGEWGGCYDIPSYHQQIVSFARANYLPLVYFAEVNVIVSGKANPLTLNANGLLVQAGFKSIMGT